MGNTNSQQGFTPEQIYAQYIQQQQDLIFQQQQQINKLYQMNMSNQTQTNMFLQTSLYSSQNRQPDQQQNRQQREYSESLPKLPSAKQKIDPYKILGISKNYDETILKKAYLKAAMKTHPDRGGSQDAFQKVSIAYTLLQKKLKETDNSHSHTELRDSSKSFMNTQASQPKLNTKLTEKFDVDVFNKIYTDNKIEDVYDEGYGDWMNKNSLSDRKQTKLFQNGFNKDMFNSTFEQYKKEQLQQHQKEGTLVRYDTPETRISMRNQDSLVTLGQGKITDFSGASNDLSFTDYKKAFTHGATLGIDPSSVNTSDRASSMQGIKSQRSNLSYQMTAADEQKVSLQKIREQKEEQKRIERLNVYDQRHGDSYEKIHSLLLRN